MSIILDFHNGLNLELYSNLSFDNTEDILVLHNIYTRNNLIEFKYIYKILNIYLAVNKIRYNWVGLAFM
jgi:hypothetical protein